MLSLDTDKKESNVGFNSISHSFSIIIPFTVDDYSLFLAY